MSYTLECTGGLCVADDDIFYKVTLHVWKSPVTGMCEWWAGGPQSSRRTSEQQSSIAIQIKASCHMCGWVMSHICMSHVAHTNESCRTYDRVMSHIWAGGPQSHVFHMRIRQVTRTNKSGHTYEWVTRVHTSWNTYKRVMEHLSKSHLWKSHVTHMSRRTSDQHDYAALRVMSHVWMIHVTRTNESCHISEYVVAYIWKSHVTHMSRRTSE